MQSATTSQSSWSSAFDPTSLLETEYSDDLNTRLTPIPEGEYMAHIKSIVPRSGVKDGVPWFAADVNFIIDDEEVKTATQLREPMARLGLFLDMKPGTTVLATKEDNPNANVKLGKLKEAVGLKPGRKWSLRHLEGLSCYVKIKQRTDPNDIETVYSDVVSVTKEPSDRRRAAA